MRSKISYMIELSTTRYFWPRYVLASLIPEPYWLRRLVTSSDSQGSGFGPSGFGGAAGLAAAGAAGLAAAGAGFSPVAAAGAGFAGSLGFAVTRACALASATFDCGAEASVGTTAFSTGGVSPPGVGETGFGPLLSSGISLPLVLAGPAIREL